MRNLIQILTVNLFVLLPMLGTLCACSDKKDDVAGGITDIDHSVAYAGKVVDESGNPVAKARVAAYIDNSTAVEDSLVTVTDESGSYELVFDRDISGDTVMVLAEFESLCALENLGAVEGSQGSESFDLQVLERKSVKGRVEGANSGYVRIKGTALKAEIAEDGTFSLEGVPSGSALLLQYVQGDSAMVAFTVSTADTAGTIELPNLVEVHLSMEGGEVVYDNDSTLAESVEYVEGISGKAIALKPGQFIDLGTLDPTDGDFTISLWTRWNGPNGEHQILVSQRSYWSDSTSKFQWHFENEDGKFAVMKSAPRAPMEITFGDSSVVPVGVWCQLTLVSRDHQVSMFVNGKQVGETSAFVPNSLDRGVPFRIGGDEIKTETWNGVIDEVRIENVARIPEGNP